MSSWSLEFLLFFCWPYPGLYCAVSHFSVIKNFVVTINRYSWKSHGWRSPVGYSLWGHKESDRTERLSFPLIIIRSRFYALLVPRQWWTPSLVYSQSHKTSYTSINLNLWIYLPPCRRLTIINCPRKSLAVQWLGLWVLTAEGQGSIPVQETGILQSVQDGHTHTQNK